MKASRICLALSSLVLNGACSARNLDVLELEPDTLSTALIAHYTFDERGGTVLTDHSGNKRDGTLTGGAWLDDGRFAGGYRFAGEEYAVVPNFPDATRSFSVSLWVRASNTPLDGFETLLSTEIPFQGGWQMNLDKAAPALGIHIAYWDPPIDDYTLHECACVPEDRWVHLAFVLDAASATLSTYLDAALIDVTPAPRPIVTGSPELYLGRWSGNVRFLVGDLDEIAIYGRALVPAEIALLQQSPAPALN